MQSQGRDKLAACPHEKDSTAETGLPEPYPRGYRTDGIDLTRSRGPTAAGL
jgi:hypothetical protein